MRMVRWGAWLWLCALPFVSWVRVGVWSSEEALWRDAYRKAPSKVRPMVNIGNAHAHRGELSLAAGWYWDAIAAATVDGRPVYEQRTGWAVAMTNLAVVELQSGQREQGLRRLRDVLRRFPNFQSALVIARQVGA